MGLRVIDGYSRLKEYIPVTGTFVPNPDTSEIYNRSYSVFKTLYSQNKKSFQILNETSK